MASAVIGALRVNLGIDSAAFQDGLKSAQSSLSRFSNALKVGIMGAAAGVAAALTGIGLAVRGMIDEADQLSKAAQSVGMATEELSRLKWAADLSGVSFESLTGSLAKLSNAMAQSLTSATSQQALAFKTLGINVQNADGTMRSSREVLDMIAESFAHMKDGTEKTALAMQIFGRSGAQLIPLLNAGQFGLMEMADEAERLGIVIDTNTGKRAEVFNDTLTRLHAIFKGMVTQIMSGALPAMQALADSFYNAGGESGRLQIIVDAAVWSFKALASVGIVVIDTFRSLGETIMGIQDAASMAFNSDLTGAWTRLGQIAKRNDEIFAKTNADIEAIWSNVAKVPEGAGDFIPRVLGVPELPGAVAAHQAAAKQVEDAWAGMRNVTVANEGTVKKFGDTAADVARSVSSSISSWIDGAIDKTFNFRDAIGGLLSDIGKLMINNAITSLFGGLKLPGFADGGSFQVGGAGGIDSQLVAFKASPNETVSITKPGQSIGDGSSGGYAPVFNIDARGAVEGTAAQIKRALMDYDRSSYQRHVANHQMAVRDRRVR